MKCRVFLALVTAVFVFGLCACRTTDATDAPNKTTHQTKGSSATISLFAPTTPLCIKVTDREEQPLVGAELPYGEALVPTRLMNILTDLLQHYPITDPPSSRKSRPPIGMEQVLHYIDQHYNESILLATSAGILHINKAYFSQVFRESNGIRPKEYIVKTRVATAAQQLKSSDRGVLEIAQSCGFNSLFNFCTAFKRITGQSPAQYRVHPMD